MFRRFSSRQKKITKLAPKSCILALDIGTEVVKALVVETGENRGTVLGVGKTRQKLGDMHSGAIIDILGVTLNCKEAITAAIEQARVMPDQLIMGIAGELVKGSTTTLSYKRTDPERPITIDELKNIVHKIQWKAFRDVRAQLAFETGFPEIEVKLVNAAVTDVRIDGYKVSNPLSFQGKDIQMSVFNSFAPLVHLSSLQSIANELDMDLLAITAEPYAMSRSLGQEDSGDFSAIFIDIGGGTTDIAVVQAGACAGTKMFGLGGRTFTKRLTESLQISFLEAEEIKIAYSKNELDEKSTKAVQSCMQRDCQVWLSGVELALSEFENVNMMPSRILICGGGSLLPEIKEALQQTDWLENLPFAKRPNVDFIQPKDVTNIVDKTGLLRDPSDITPMALANIALDMAGEERLIPMLLRKAIKLMKV